MDTSPPPLAWKESTTLKLIIGQNTDRKQSEELGNERTTSPIFGLRSRLVWI